MEFDNDVFLFMTVFLHCLMIVFSFCAHVNTFLLVLYFILLLCMIIVYGIKEYFEEKYESLIMNFMNIPHLCLNFLVSCVCTIIGCYYTVLNIRLSDEKGYFIIFQFFIAYQLYFYLFRFFFFIQVNISDVSLNYSQLHVTKSIWFLFFNILHFFYPCFITTCLLAFSPYLWSIGILPNMYQLFYWFVDLVHIYLGGNHVCNLFTTCFELSIQCGLICLLKNKSFETFEEKFKTIFCYLSVSIFRLIPIHKNSWKIFKRYFTSSKFIYLLFFVCPILFVLFNDVFHSFTSFIQSYLRIGCVVICLLSLGFLFRRPNILMSFVQIFLDGEGETLETIFRHITKCICFPIIYLFFPILLIDSFFYDSNYMFLTSNVFTKFEIFETFKIADVAKYILLIMNFKLIYSRNTMNIIVFFMINIIESEFNMFSCHYMERFYFIHLFLYFVNRFVEIAQLMVYTEFSPTRFNLSPLSINFFRILVENFFIPAKIILSIFFNFHIYYVVQSGFGLTLSAPFPNRFFLSSQTIIDSTISNDISMLPEINFLHRMGKRVFNDYVSPFTTTGTVYLVINEDSSDYMVRYYDFGFGWCSFEGRVLNRKRTACHSGEIEADFFSGLYTPVQTIRHTKYPELQTLSYDVIPDSNMTIPNDFVCSLYNILIKEDEKVIESFENFVNYCLAKKETTFKQDEKGSELNIEDISASLSEHNDTIEESYQNENIEPIFDCSEATELDYDSLLYEGDLKLKTKEVKNEEEVEEVELIDFSEDMINNFFNVNVDDETNISNPNLLKMIRKLVYWFNFADKEAKCKKYFYWLSCFGVFCFNPTGCSFSTFKTLPKYILFKNPMIFMKDLKGYYHYFFKSLLVDYPHLSKYFFKATCLSLMANNTHVTCVYPEDCSFNELSEFLDSLKDFNALFLPFGPLMDLSQVGEQLNEYFDQIIDQSFEFFMYQFSFCGIKEVTVFSKSHQIRLMKMSDAMLKSGWLSAMHEVLILNNTDSERSSFQQNPVIFANVTASSCSQPVGYPDLVIPLIVS
eukprot:TRINITY_DN13_c0_g1_i1.p1 TRINITY_DN13_c0_g1~~TRINITY_DN13_c0_g1_i1.p1  ORF type:complete len:1091 (-),score=257.88 TRINITY_DN13_c0_g1_i1:81-3164(-)